MVASAESGEDTRGIRRATLLFEEPKHAPPVDRRVEARDIGREDPARAKMRPRVRKGAAPSDGKAVFAWRAVPLKFRKQDKLTFPEQPMNPQHLPGSSARRID